MSLIFYTDENQALVATDTLVVSEEDREPLYFASKAVYVPHLKTIIAYTGLARFMEQWFSIVNQLPAGGVQELDNYSPGNLDRLFAWFNSVNEGKTTQGITVYHIGFSEKEGRISAFAYSSANNFKSEPLAYGLAIKPLCPPPEGSFTFIDDVPGLMRKQREEQKKVEPGQRVHIGGEIFGMYLTAESCNSFKLGVFDDYREHKQKIDLRRQAR